jgi:hypothetical protein
VEDTSAVGPVAVQANCLKESITFLEEEMIIDELFFLGLSHLVQ